MLWLILGLGLLRRSLVRKIINRQSKSAGHRGKRYLLLLGSLGGAILLVSFGLGLLSALSQR